MACPSVCLPGRSNFMSAMALYTSTPFIKGDRIQLKSLSGSTIVAGGWVGGWVG